jgi:hypothetical protein
MTAGTLPVFVLGTIADFACLTAADAVVRVGAVCRRWREAVENEDPLWTRLRAARFVVQKLPDEGDARPVVNCTFRAYRARAIAAAQLRPLAREDLHEIESCGVLQAEEVRRSDDSEPAASGAKPRLVFKGKFRCPLFGESLVATGKRTGSGRPVLHCDVCDRHVYTVGTLAELAEYAGKQCVRFPKSLFADSAAAKLVDTVHVAIVDPAPGAAAALTVVRAVRENFSVAAHNLAVAPRVEVRLVDIDTIFVIWAVYAAPSGHKDMPPVLCTPDGAVITTGAVRFTHVYEISPGASGSRDSWLAQLQAKVPRESAGAPTSLAAAHSSRRVNALSVTEPARGATVVGLLQEIYCQTDMWDGDIG